MKLKGLTLALVFTLIGAAAVSVDAANINGDVIDEELLDGEMDVDEVFGNVESGTGPEDMEDESEDSEGGLEGFDVEGFIDGFIVDIFNFFSNAFTQDSEGELEGI